jgi:hypothetical protein
MTILRFARHEIIEALIKLSSEETTLNPHRSSVESVHQIVSFLASDCFGFSYTIISVKNCTISQLYAIFMLNNFKLCGCFPKSIGTKNTTHRIFRDMYQKNTNALRGVPCEIYCSYYNHCSIRNIATLPQGAAQLPVEYIETSLVQSSAVRYNT